MSVRSIALIVCALIGCPSALRAGLLAPSYYYIDGHRLQTIGPTLKALEIAYAQNSRQSALPPWRALVGHVVDVVRQDDGAYSVELSVPTREAVRIPSSAVAAADVTLSNPLYKSAETKSSVTLLGLDAAALVVAAREWDRVSSRVYHDGASQDIANYGVFLGMVYLHGAMYYSVVLTPLYFPCLPRCTVAASDWQIHINAETFEAGHFQSVGANRVTRIEGE